jgi:hypothetical protein
MQQIALSLEQFQQWMKTVISYPGSYDDAWTSPEANAILPAEIAETLVLPSKYLSPKERMQAYQYAYFARLEDALSGDYEAVKHFLGEDEFERISRLYFEHYPSKSYTLNVAGVHFPEFLTTIHHKKQDFIVELARLEQTISHIMDVEESTIVTPEAIAAIPHDAWDSVRIIPIAGFALLANHYPVNSYLSAVLNHKPTPKIIRRKQEYIVIFRNEYLTWRMTLEHSAFVLLNAIADGNTLGDAISLLAKQFADDIHNIEPKISAWFQQWIENGFFQALEIAN